MARAKRAAAPPKTVDELVLHALRLAATNPKAKWLGKSDKALFDENETNHAAAIAACMKADSPLLKQEGASGTLTAAGFERVAGALPAEEAARITKAVAATMQPAERVVFLQDAISRTPGAEAELVPLLDEATAAKDATQRAEDARFAAQAAAKAAKQAALERALELCKQDRQNDIDSVLRRWVALGQKPDALPAHTPRPETEATPEWDRVTTATLVAADARDVTERLVSAWLYNTRHGKVEAATALERVLAGIEGVEPIGSADQDVAFDGRIHECERGVSDGERVRVIRPGWAIEGETGAPLLRALVG